MGFKSWSRRMKRKVLKWVAKQVPELGESVSVSVNSYIDEYQEVLDTQIEEFIREQLPDGVVEDAAIKAYRNFLEEILDDFIDHVQEEYLSKEAITKLADKL